MWKVEGIFVQEAQGTEVSSFAAVTLKGRGHVVRVIR